MRTSFVRASIAVLALGAFTACPPSGPQECIEGDEEVCDAGLPEDFCDSIEEAEADSEHCHLTVGTMAGQMVRKTDLFISTLGDGGIDKDFYFAQMPGTLTPRSLLHINGGYQAPQSAVDFSINVLQRQADGGLGSVVAGSDRHGAGAPRPVDIIIPFADANAKLFVLAAHEQLNSQVKVDNRNPYSLLVEVLDNPDTNEPNDSAAMATTIPMAAGGGGQQGTQSGYLATTDDVDQYKFSMGQGGRQIIYVRILGPDPHPTNPPPPFRLAYVLSDPSGNPISEGQVENEFVRIDLSTARLAPTMGDYTIKLSAYKPSGSTAPVKGDLRIRYDIEVRIIPDLDLQEPNDTLMTARSVSLAPNSSQAITGKLSTVPDEEWFRVTLPAGGTPSVLRWELTAANGGGRFPPLAPTATRQVRFMKQVTQGATSQDRQNSCIQDKLACPKGYDDPSSDPALLVEAVCKTADPAPCLWAQRNEHPDYDNLKNLVGALPIAANQATEFYLLVRDEGRGRLKYADDRDWTLNLTREDDPDEARATPIVSALSGSTTEVTGALTYGYGRFLNFDFERRRGAGIRGPEDYDAYDTDRDLYQFNVAGAVDQSWQLEWVIEHGDGGSPPGEVAFEFTFCGTGAAGDGGLCGGSQTRIFAFTTDPQTPWYTPPTLQYATMLISRQTQANATTLTVQPVACQCLMAPRVAAGRFYANLLAVDRVGNAPLVYRVRQSLGAYPTSYTGDGGVSVSCPALDGGCGFAR
ncbi:MAG: hypothetical protein AMXMBFR34_52370 [Myxococcaceae bacterium]